MPSTNKTSFLLLNKWVASDSPKMSDFNSDNQKLDDAIKAHHESAALHLSAAQSTWLNQPMLTGAYEGDGALSRTVTLGFQPALALVFANTYAPMEKNPNDDFWVLRQAVAAGSYGTPGLAITAAGFQVTQHQSDPIPGLYRLNLNEIGVTYVYFVVK